MNFSSIVTINIYSVAILLIVFIIVLKTTAQNHVQRKLFLLMLLSTALMLILDVFSRLDGRPDTFFSTVNHVANFLIFLVAPGLPSLWLLYVCFHMNNTTSHIGKCIILLSITCAINTILVILTLHFGWLYYIDAANIYHRGPLYWFPVLSSAVLITAAVILVLINRKRFEKKDFISLILFPIPPVISIIFQVIFYGTSLILNGATLSVLIAFISIQNDSMNADYLTGAYNRKGLDIHLRQKINACSETKTFSVILLDLNNFKKINDEFGHSVGDDALITSVQLLKRCTKSGDIVARYGGDEFFIIMNISIPSELEAAVRRIERCIDIFNATGEKPFSLGFSIGHAVYEYNTHLTAEQFQNHVDMLMYKHKRTEKLISDRPSNTTI